MSRLAAAAVLACVLGVAAAAAAPDVSLTGFAATKKAWYAHHKLDRTPILVPGCCFGPRQNDGQDRYYNVQYSSNRVYMYDMDFGPRVSASDARKQAAKELPADAKLVAHKKRPHCEQFVYRSAAVKRATGNRAVGVEFSSDVKSGPYDGKVKKIVVGSLVTTRERCGIG